MMLTMLALMAQTTPAAAPAQQTATARVTKPAAQAAMRCAVVAVAGAPEGQSALRSTSHFMYFVMQAARLDQGGKPFLTRLQDLASNIDANSTPAAAEAKAALVTCDSTYPLARAQKPVRLPTDSFNRDVMCMGTLSLLQGAAQSMAEEGGDKTPLENITTGLKPYSDHLTDDELTKRNMASEEKFIAAMGDQLIASLSLGNPETVARACGVTSL